MDPSEFDRLAHALGRAASRRAALAALLTGLLAPVLPEGSLAARGGGKRTGRDKDNGQTKRRANSRGKDQGKAREKRRNRMQTSQRATAEARAANCYPSKTCALGKGKNASTCDFSGSVAFKGKNLSGANLGASNLGRVDASGANLQGGNLGRACLVDANLIDAKLGGANTSGAVFCRTIMPDGRGNDSGCGRGTACCPTCDAAHACPEGQICCEGRCVAGECCRAADCAAEPCRTTTCQAHRCRSQPVTCTARDQCHEAGVCDPNTGECSQPGKANGVGCDDGDPCTESDRCVNGACVGESISGCVRCTRAEDCPTSPRECQRSICADDGRCGFAALVGSRCDAGDPCTVEAECDSRGDCVGTVMVGCRACQTAADCPPPATPCQTAVCTSDGICDVDTRPDGDSCDDGNACTKDDACQNGQCAGKPVADCLPCASVADCPPHANPCMEALCWRDGTCQYSGKIGGAPCTDDNPCRQGPGFCAIGGPTLVCQGGLIPGCVPCATTADCPTPSDPCFVANCASNGTCRTQYGGNHALCDGDGFECTVGICDPNLGCQRGIVSDQCLIDGVCYAPPRGFRNPANACQVCLPGTSQTAWTQLEEGASCDPFGGTCRCGECRNTCTASGQLCQTHCECCSDVCVPPKGGGHSRCCNREQEPCQSDAECCNNACIDGACARQSGGGGVL